MPLKIVVDAMGTEWGGIRTYIDQLLDAWPQIAPDDELHVVAPAGSGIGAGHTVHEIAVRQPGFLARPLQQTSRIRRLVREIGADAVLAAMPATSLRRTGAPLTIVVHDLRHDLRPQEFSRGRRLLRRVSYRRSYSIADGFIAVSARTMNDLHTCYPATSGTLSTVVHHGADHVLRWTAAADADRTGGALAFAHHTNKSPELILDGWAELAARGVRRPLTIVGVGSDHRSELQERIDAHGLTDLVQLAPFLGQDDFAALFVHASEVIFPSTFEGFGLPILEAMILGKPVVVGTEPASMEVGGDHVVIMDGWDAADLADAAQRAFDLDDAAVAAGQEWARAFTWAEAARKTRDALLASTHQLDVSGRPSS